MYIFKFHFSYILILSLTINEYRLKIRDKGKRKLKKKVKFLKYEIRNGRMTSKEAHKYLAGHLGYIKIANVERLKDKLFSKDIYK